MTMLDLSYALAGETRDPFFVPGKEDELISFGCGLLIGSPVPLTCFTLPLNCTNAELTLIQAASAVLFALKGFVSGCSDCADGERPMRGGRASYETQMKQSSSPADKPSTAHCLHACPPVNVYGMRAQFSPTAAMAGEADITVRPEPPRCVGERRSRNTAVRGWLRRRRY